MTLSGKKTVRRVLIVDDHPLVRHGFAKLISDEPNLQVCGEASDADEAMVMIKKYRPELAIVDLSLGGMSGLDLIKRIGGFDESIRILVVSMHDEVLFAQRCVRAGASGYINKEVATERVIEAINQVLAGEIYLSPAITRRVLKNIAGGGDKDSSPISRLTDRELEVFALLGRGNTTREISELLNLSIKTIETYRENIKSKLDITTSAELSRHAVQWVLENG
jgi:DNA-binding NarL/FixJ family response regulator